MKLLLFTLCLLGTLGLQAQHSREILTFKVVADDVSRKDCPVGVDLSGSGLELQNSFFQLYELKGKTVVPVPCQIDNSSAPRLYFIMSGILKKGESRSYELRTVDEKTVETAGSTVKIRKDHENLKLFCGDRPVLSYQFGVVFPPAGVDPLFKRSGFIHPLWSPAGEVLTRIQAPDHYHHYGIWGPWTVTHIEGREVDFWNLNKGQGTVCFANLLSEVEGPVFSGFTVLQQHIDFGAKGGDRVAINETLEVSAWNIDEGRTWLIDYVSAMNCPLEKGMVLDAYRYGGGIGFRGTEQWTRHNSTVITSEGADRTSADGSRARWCVIEGESSAGRSGILFMSHPSNREFPEPMRVWPIDANNGRGDMFFEFCPIRHNSWELEKGKNYSQRYRLVVFDGEMPAEEAERYWAAFASMPAIQVVNNKK